MRKTLFVVLVVVLALLPSFSAAAQPASIDDLTTLADHFPSDTVAFVALRTDQAHFTELDVLLNQLNANFGGDVLPPGFGSRDLFDLLLIDTFGLSSDILFNWLGGDCRSAGDRSRGSRRLHAPSGRYRPGRNHHARIHGLYRYGRHIDGAGERYGVCTGRKL
jgi:hypothetical protein